MSSDALVSGFVRRREVVRTQARFYSFERRLANAPGDEDPFPHRPHAREPGARGRLT
jgi:hypothetical protein